MLTEAITMGFGATIGVFAALVAILITLVILRWALRVITKLILAAL